MDTTHRYTSIARSTGTHPTEQQGRRSGPPQPESLVAEAELDWIAEHYAEALQMARGAARGDLGPLTAHEVVDAAYDALLNRRVPWLRRDPRVNVRLQIRWSFTTLICDVRRRQRAEEPIRHHGEEEEHPADPDERRTRRQRRDGDVLLDPASTACWGGLQDLYVELNHLLADARTRSDAEAISAALALLTLALDPSSVDANEHRGRTASQELVAHAVAVARPTLDPTRRLTTAQRKERQRLADHARRLLARVHHDHSEAA